MCKRTCQKREWSKSLWDFSLSEADEKSLVVEKLLADHLTIGLV